MPVKYEWLIIILLFPITLLLGYNYFFRNKETVKTEYQVKETKIEHIFDLKKELKSNQEKFQKQIDENNNIIEKHINKINDEKNKLEILEKSIRNNDSISVDSCIQVWKSINL